MKNAISLANKLMSTGPGQVIINRLTVMASGLGIALLAPLTLAPAEQGYFFTFLSLASLQGLFELGITALLIQHFAHLKGNGPGLAGANTDVLPQVHRIYVFAETYFKRAGLLFTGLVGGGGAVFFVYSQGIESSAIWLGPWVILVFATAISLFNLSGFCAVEGFGSLQRSYRIRTQGIWLLLCVFATGMLLAGSLYVHPVAFLVCQGYYALKLSRERKLIGICARGADEPALAEPQGLRENQKKFAVSAVAGFFTASSITPYAFHFFGPVVAGQVGLTASMFMAAASLAMAFSTADAPIYGQLISQGRAAHVFKAWRRNVSYSLVSAFLLSGILIAINVVINAMFPVYAVKVLGFSAFLFLGIMVVANTTLSTVSTVLRAFKTEVLMWPSVIAALISLVLQFGMRVDPAYYFLGMAIYNGMIFLPYAFYLMMRQLDVGRPALVAE